MSLKSEPVLGSGARIVSPIFKPAQRAIGLGGRDRQSKTKQKVFMSFLSEIKGFSRSALRNTETTVTRADGRQYTEKMDEFGYSRRVSRASTGSAGYVVDFKPDLQVGRILPDLLLGEL